MGFFKKFGRGVNHSFNKASHAVGGLTKQISKPVSSVAKFAGKQIDKTTSIPLNISKGLSNPMVLVAIAGVVLVIMMQRR